MKTNQNGVCPGCGNELDERGTRLVCSTCESVFVTNEDLESMMNDLSPDTQLHLAQRLGAVNEETPRACPRCATPMRSVTLQGVGLEQCGAHGVWFDKTELAKVLHANGRAYAQREGFPTDAWLFIDTLFGSVTGVIENLLRKSRDPKVPEELRDQTR